MGMPTDDAAALVRLLTVPPLPEERLIIETMEGFIDGTATVDDLRAAFQLAYECADWSKAPYRRQLSVRVVEEPGFLEAYCSRLLDRLGNQDCAAAGVQ